MSKDINLKKLLYGGILILIYTIVGDVLFFDSLYIIGLDHLGEPLPSLYLTYFFIYMYVALYGGFLIILGYYLFKYEFIKTGKLFTMLGIILAIFAMALFVIVAVIDLMLLRAFFLILLVLFAISIGIGIVGLLLSITSYIKLLKIIKNSV
jgi:hypothetical protein